MQAKSKSNRKRGIQPGEVRNPTGKGGYLPGQSGNLDGRPPNTKFFSDYVKIFAGLTKPEILAIANDDTRVGGERLAALEFANALDGKDQSVERILQRTEGKVTDKHEHAIVSFEEFDESTLIKRGQELASRAGEAGIGTPVPIPAPSEEQQPAAVSGEPSEGAGGSGGQPQRKDGDGGL